MNKEEILAKSRNENKDEGLEQAENKGRAIGIVTFCIVFVVITIFNFINGINSSSIFSIFYAFLAAEALPKYRFTKKASYLIVTIAGATASILYLFSHILEVLR